MQLARVTPHSYLRVNGTIHYGVQWNMKTIKENTPNSFITEFRDNKKLIAKFHLFCRVCWTKKKKNSNSESWKYALRPFYARDSLGWSCLRLHHKEIPCDGERQRLGEHRSGGCLSWVLGMLSFLLSASLAYVPPAPHHSESPGFRGGGLSLQGDARTGSSLWTSHRMSFLMYPKQRVTHAPSHPLPCGPQAVPTSCSRELTWRPSQPSMTNSASCQFFVSY